MTIPASGGATTTTWEETDMTTPISIDRRRLICAGLTAGLMASLGARPALAQGASLKVGFISPRTGPLAGFGKTDGYVLDLARAALAPGLTVGGTAYPVEILDRDTQSNPSIALA